MRKVTGGGGLDNNSFLKEFNSSKFLYPLTSFKENQKTLEAA